MSRYIGRYDSDRRSRSPRERSPDRYNDRASQYSDGDRRRVSGESRSNSSAFPSNRDTLRDSVTGREPPRGPKALLEPPSGPRGTGYGNEFRGRGRGRGRGWRDDSRDRGRDRDDFRDRRDGPPYRDDRSREREWRDRDSFRGRRASPPPRGRSPPGRDYRDRDIPLGLDADRARRGSRDGPLSAGSSSSDPPFVSQQYRGPAFRGGRGGPRGGRGDWDRGRGRGFYDDRDRFRSRSQEGRWGRDRDDRDRDRYIEPDMRSRDSRDDRDMREREIRGKADRASVTHEAPPAKDVSPPPLAPSAPAFGTVPSRQPSITEHHPSAPKVPPTGPRALAERPASSGHEGGEPRPPPVGLSKSSLPSLSPPIPTGPRAQQQRPSSMQWINPNITSKGPKVPPESPKIGRSQSFVSHQPRPFGPRLDSSRPEHQPDLERRPRSSDAKAESQVAATDERTRSLPSEPEVLEQRDRHMSEDQDHSRRSIDSDQKPPLASPDIKMGGTEPSDRASTSSVVSPTMQRTASPVGSRPDEPHNEEVKEPEISETPVEVSVTSPSAVPKSLSVRFSLPPAVATLPAADQSSDSDDEDIDDYFDSEIAKAEAELSKLEAVSESVPTEIVVRLAVLEHEHLAATVTEEGLKTLVGPLPEGVEFPRAKPVVQPPEEPSAEPAAEAKAPSPQPQTEAEPAQPVEAVVPLDSTTIQEPHVPAEPQPKVEEMDTDSAHIPIPTVEHPEPRGEEPAVVDVQMEDVGQDTDEAAKPETPQVNGHSNEGARHLLPAGFEMPPTGLSTPSQMEVEEAEEDDDETEIEEPDWATIETVRQYMKTPPLDELPDFSCRPWYKDRKFLKSFEPDPSVQAFVSSLIRDEAIVKYATQQEARHDYARQYEKYLRFTLSDDPAAVKSREFFSSIYPPSDAIVHPGPGHEPKPEGRRTGSRFATERDLERVLQASIQEEKERKERQERAEREKHRNPEKEADIPEMFWTPKEREVELFYDQSAFLPTEKLVAAWQVLPPVANFTEEEAELFEKAYLEFPKQWGKIAENIPTRDFHSCIQYYYIKKRELKLKEKLKKQPRRRKKRGKQRSSALVSELGNPDEVVEENHENGEHGERRRPRRAAAPTWNFEATPAADSDGAATPGRRGHGSKNDSGAEKPEKRSRRRGAHKEKEPKHAKQAQNLAPTPAATAKTNRSRSNSRAQGPEFLSPQTPADIASPATGMQPPLVPTQLPVSPDRGIPTTSSTMSEVMAPPSLRPDPPPPPPSTIAAFDLGQHSGSDRVRTPQQASSYWSVSETTDFPNLLASFGSDWNAIANHMQTKTHVMVKNYYVRQRDSGKQKDWELMVAEADAKRQRGDKLPTPPAVTAGPRTKRLDGPATSHRPLAAAGAPEEPHTAKETQVPLQPATAFGRFQVPVPIAQAPPAISASSSVSSGQSQQPLVPSQPQAAAVQQQAQPQPASQAAMSPTARPSRTPLVSGGYPEREPEPIASVPAQQPVRVPQKPGPPQVVFQQAGPASTPTDRDVWPSNYEPRLNLFNTSQQRRQPVELQPKEESRSMRLKQEPEAVLHYESSVPGQAHQPIARGGTARNEPVPIARQPEPPRSVAPAPQPYAAAQQPFKSILSEPVQGPSALSSAIERPMSAMQRPMSHSVPEPYSASTPQPPPQSLAPPPSRPPERKTSSLMALLNDDPPAAPPKRVSDMASTGLKPSSTPPPQSISRAPPPSAASQLRREGTPTYSPYSRNAPVQSAIPSLKPYAPTQTQSPQPQHLSAPRGSMMSPIEAGSVSDRDFYARHPYQPQVQQGASNSPQSHHYPPPQQSQLGYQSQPPPYGYGSPASQGHAPSPTPRYAAHPSVQARPDTGPPSRETAWPIPQSQQAPPSASQQPAWPQPKAAQPQPSAWGAQHGAPQKATPVTGSMPPQPSWSSAPPQHMSLRDVRDVRDDRSPVYAAMHDPRAAGGGDPRMMGHQHQSSLFGGRYPPTPTPRPEAAPPQQQVPPYPRYAGTPGPGQARDPGPGRSYTPVSAYDNRPPGPPQGPYVQEVQMRQDAQMRQEVQMRDLRGELRGDPRDLRGDLRDPRDPVSQLQRGLRPHEDYRQQERRY